MPPKTPRAPRPLLGAAAAALGVAVAVIACSGKTTQAGLELILATNLTAPSDFDAVRLEVSQETGARDASDSWQRVFTRSWRVPAETALPTTFSLAAGTAPDQDALIRLVALKDGAPVVLREAQVQVPKDRVAALTLILSAACLGKVAVDPGSGEAVPTCAIAGDSCQPGTGACGSSVIDPGTLPPYVPGSEGTVDAGARDATLPPPEDAGGAVDAADATLAPPDAEAGAVALLSLAPSIGALVPPFSPDVHAYAVSLSDSFGIDPFTLTATAADPAAILAVNGATTASGVASAPVALATAGTTTIDVAVTSAGATEHYAVAVANAPQTTYVKPSIVGANNQFGEVVALDGDTLAVTALVEAAQVGDASVAQAGVVYVFTRAAGVWTQQARIQAPNPDYALFGSSLALSGDTLVVGSNSESGGGQGVFAAPPDAGVRHDSGAVYVFTRTGTTWSLQSYLKASNASVNASFGTSLALSGDTLVVGAGTEGCAQADGGGTFLSTYVGAAYVFQRAGSTWTEQAYLKASNLAPSGYFGAEVALSGNTIAVGAAWEASLGAGVNGDQTQADGGAYAGAVYVFVGSGATWTQQAYIKASNTAPNNIFCSVSLDGDTLVVGADGEGSLSRGINGDQTQVEAGASAGAAYVFTRASGAWSQQAYLKASNAAASNVFGRDVVLKGDVLAVGAMGEASLATGINGDQTQSDAGTYAGAVYVFRRTGTTWAQTEYVKATNSRAWSIFGSTPALSGDTLAVGAFGESSLATGIDGDGGASDAGYVGAAYVYQ